jgi:hypothetical protein
MYWPPRPAPSTSMTPAPRPGLPPLMAPTPAPPVAPTWRPPHDQWTGMVQALGVSLSDRCSTHSILLSFPLSPQLSQTSCFWLSMFSQHPLYLPR